VPGQRGQDEGHVAHGARVDERHHVTEDELAVRKPEGDVDDLRGAAKVPRDLRGSAAAQTFPPHAAEEHGLRESTWKSAGAARHTARMGGGS